MVDGGTFNQRTINPIGLVKAGKVWYRAQTVYLTTGSNFLAAYHALNQACTDLIGTSGITASDCTQVKLALDAVELSRHNSCAGAVAMPQACPNGASQSVSHFFSTFDPPAAEWTTTSTTATFWGIGNFYAFGGDFHGFGPNVGFTSDHSLVHTNAIAIPAGARMAFRHAFEVEYDTGNNYDGGVLEYSTDNGVTWNDVVTGPAGNLIVAGQSYNGPIYNNPADPFSTNPLKGRQAFVRHSFGYTGTVLNLGPLAGQNVKFRWRLGTDEIVDSFGWAVDDVRIYTCAGAANGEMIFNGSFTGSTAGWIPFGTPTVPEGIQFNNTGDRFNYYRPPGSTQGVVLQQTGLSVQAGTTLEAVWTMGNTDPGSLRKRFSVIIGEGDGATQFSDMHVCTYFLDPGQIGQTYRMRTFTSKDVTNLTIWFYAANPANGVGNTTTYQLDNVSMMVKPGHSPFKTDCEDPLRPLAGGATSGNLIFNGDFAGGETGWIRTGNLAGQWNPGGWADFFKLAPAVPPGVILQQIAGPFAQDQRLEATFQLGNSSNVRQRVTVIINEPGFTDMSACTIWLPPGLARQTFRMRSYANIGWANAMLSVYPATVGTSPSHNWLQLDNVTFQRVTTANWGTECFDPGS
jgi:hypothetical protein